MVLWAALFAALLAGDGMKPWTAARIAAVQRLAAPAAEATVRPFWFESF